MYAVDAMRGSMFLTWDIAAWASYQEPANQTSAAPVRRELKKAA